jgi:hypothetical protein
MVQPFPPLMIFGEWAFLLGMVWQPLGKPFTYLRWLFIVFTIRTFERLARLLCRNLPPRMMVLVAVISI